MPHAAALLALLTPISAGGAPPPPAPATCPRFEWVTLGTAGGPIPTPERAEPANLLIAGGKRYLVDTGDGTVNQLAKVGLNLGAIDGVFSSHHHLDHTGGLAAVIGLRWMNNFPGKLKVYGPKGTAELVAGIIASMQPQSRIGFGVGRPPPPPTASVEIVELQAGQAVTLGDLAITTTANSHFDHAGPQPADAPQSLSYRFAFGGRAITYTGDTGASDAVARLARGSDLLVSEVIDLDPLLADIARERPDMPAAIAADMRQHLATHHLSGEDIGKIAATAQVGRVVLTHYAVPGPLAASKQRLYHAVSAHWAGPVDAARDLSSYAVGCAVK